MQGGEVIIKVNVNELLIYPSVPDTRIEKVPLKVESVDYTSNWLRLGLNMINA